MRYGSVCSGIECASAAFQPLGWTPAFFAEIEKFPSAVLAHRYGSNLPGEPLATNGVPNFGDVTGYEEWPDAAIDLLIGGTPCQSYSVAGLRKGLDDPRGDLTLTYAAVARKYRPRWLVWENVFGVLSDDGGRSFASLLALLSGRKVEAPQGGWKSAGIVEGYEGAYGLAWRVLDAQYIRVDGFGRAVPQRRRRVFVVGHSGGDWRRAAAVLLERESLSGNPAPCREAGKGAAADAQVGFGGGRQSGSLAAAACLTAKGQRIDFEVETFIATGFECGPQGGGFIEVAPTLDTRCKDGPIRNQLGIGVMEAAPAAPPLTSNPYGDHESREGLLVAHTLRGEGYDASEDGTGRGTPLAPVFAIQERAICENPDAGPDGVGVRGDGASYTLEARTVCQAVAFDTTQITSPSNYSKPKAGAPCHPLSATAHPPAIAFQERGRDGGRSVEIGGEVAYALTAPSGGGRTQEKNIMQGWAVRRLTPLECERLMGLPDGYTAIPHRGKPAADGPRYKALGNGFTVNSARWIARRIEMVDEIEAEIDPTESQPIIKRMRSGE